MNKAYCEKEVFDLTSFMRVPYEVERDISWNRISLGRGGSLLYLEGESAIYPEGLTRVLQLESSQIFSHFDGWFRESPAFFVEKKDGGLNRWGFIRNKNREKSALCKAIRVLENQYDLKLGR